MSDILILSFIFLFAAVIAVPLASKLGLGSVLGYLFAGIALSPLLSILGVNIVSIQHFAEFGVVMMLFLVGLELQPKELWKMRHRLLGLGGLQVGISCLAVFGIFTLLDYDWKVSLAVGLILALSSTAIVLQSLEEKKLLKSEGGQASFSILLFQDIAVIPILAFLPLLAASDLSPISVHSSGSEAHEGINLLHGLATWQVALATACAIGLVLLIGHFITPFIFRLVAITRLRELFTATALAIVIGVALLMNLVGLSPALGAFIAGVVLAGSEYRHELESDIAPFKGLLLGLFFITVGANINFDLLSENARILLPATFILIALKASILFILTTVFSIRTEGKWLVSLGMAQAGEFGFVLLGFSVSSSVIEKPLADLLMIIVALSMLATPLLFIVIDKVILHLNAKSQGKADEINQEEDVIIIGHGRVGGIINRMLRSSGIPTTVIDFNPKQLELLRKLGIPVFYGDGTRPDLLHSAGIDKARMLIIAIDKKEATTEIVEYVCKTHPQVHVIARAFDRFHVYDLWAAGCRDIIRETYDSSIRMGRSAYEAIGFEKTRAQELTTHFENMDREFMLETAELYRRDIPVQENKAYLEKVKQIFDNWEEQLKGRLNSDNSEDKQA